MKAILKKHVGNLIHKSWSIEEHALVFHETEVYKYATFSIVTFKKVGTDEPTITIRLNKRPSRYTGNIICDAWNQYILSTII